MPIDRLVWTNLGCNSLLCTVEGCELQNAKDGSRGVASWLMTKVGKPKQSLPRPGGSPLLIPSIPGVLACLYFQHICICICKLLDSDSHHSCFQVVPSSFSLFSLFGVGFTNFFKFPSLLTGPYFGFWLIHADTGARCMFKIKCSLL